LATPADRRIALQAGIYLASVLANEFTEATTDIYLQALFEIGLVLFGITILGEPSRATALCGPLPQLSNTRGAIACIGTSTTTQRGANSKARWRRDRLCFAVLVITRWVWFSFILSSTGPARELGFFHKIAGAGWSRLAVAW
jgi:hypothetical protein